MKWVICLNDIGEGSDVLENEPMFKMPAHVVVHFAVPATYTVYRSIVNTPATAKIAIEDENKPAHCFAFFSGSQKTLKFKLIR